MRTLVALPLLCAMSFAGGDADFANDLFARLAARDGNVVCSPLSVRVAMAMVYGGARGTTAEEMAKALRCDGRVHAEIAAFVKDYDGKPRGEVAMPALANAAWLQQGVDLLPAYTGLVTEHYGAPPTTIDFADADGAARRINAWVMERTRDRIKDIVTPDMFNPNSTLVLANAIHFKAAWDEPFKKRLTRDGEFRLASGGTAKMPFMVQSEHMPYAEKDGAQAIELLYEGRRFSMVVVLPAEGAPAAVPAGLVEALEGRVVSVELPRFRIESAFALEDTLRAMGMKSAFDMGADFSGINGKKDLFVGFVAHKAFVAVDEEGTEAAAATVAGLEVKGARGKPAVFRADRPFLFLIRDRETGTTLFVGRVADPRS